MKAPIAAKIICVCVYIYAVAFKYYYKIFSLLNLNLISWSEIRCCLP